MHKFKETTFPSDLMEGVTGTKSKFGGKFLSDASVELEN